MPLETPESPPTPSEEGTMSLAARLANVFAAPGEVFDEVKSSVPAIANWLFPLLLSCLVGAISVFIIFSQPGVQQQVKERQEQEIEKRVASGQLSADAGQKALSSLDGFGMTLIKVAGAVGAVIAGAAWLFGTALVLRLLGRFALHASFTYHKALEVAGLATMISTLGAVIQTLVIVVTGSIFVSLGPALFLREFNPADKLHLTLASINLPTLWYLAILSLGLAKLGGVSFAKAALGLFILWAALRGGVILLGLGGSGM